MSTETKAFTAEEKNKLARRALLHVLNRIRRSPEIAEKFGPGSESFDLLTAAAAALTGEPVAQVRNYVSPGSNALPHLSPAEYLEGM